MSHNGRERNGFHYPGNQFPPAGITLFLKDWISRFPQPEQKSLNKIILFELDRKSVSTSIENSFDSRFLLEEKAATIDRNI